MEKGKYEILEEEEEDADSEWDSQGECAMCGATGIYNIEEVGPLCPECAETFGPKDHRPGE